MQPLSHAEPAAKTRRLQFLFAGAFATFGVWLAVHQLISPAKVAESKGKGPGRNRAPAPEFWLRDHAAGRAQAQATGKPIFLVIRCEP